MNIGHGEDGDGRHHVAINVLVDNHQFLQHLRHHHHHYHHHHHHHHHLLLLHRHSDNNPNTAAAIDDHAECADEWNDDPLPAAARHGSFAAGEASNALKLATEETDQLIHVKKGHHAASSSSSSSTRSSMADLSKKKNAETKIEGAMEECRICQEEDEHANLEAPCACTGSLKFAHRRCVQHWCNEKGDTICEICLKPYQGGYTAPALAPAPDLSSFSINIGDPWEITRSSERMEVHEPSRIFAVSSDHLLSEPAYDEYARANERSAACFRSVAFVLMVVLVLRHILAFVSSGGADDVGDQQEAPTFFLLFVLRAMGFFLPCYIMGRVLNMVQGRQRRESVAASEVAYILQTTAGIQGREVRIAVPRAVSSP